MKSTNSNTGVLGVLIVMSALANTAVSADDSSDSLTKNGKAWSIEYPSSLTADADLIDKLMNAVHRATIDEFAELKPETLLEKLSLTIEIHPKPNEYASTATMTIVSSYSNGQYRATLHVFAPSKHDESAVTVVGEPKDKHYFHKSLMHEYSSLLINLITRTKETGWRFHDGPDWVVQGYPEYLALTKTTEASRKTTFVKYRELVEGDRERVTFEFGVAVMDPYVDGAMLFAFIHEQFGAAKVHRVLISREKTLGRAMVRELGVDLATFEKRWSAWLDAK